jgi:hypothetical protein
MLTPWTAAAEWLGAAKFPQDDRGSTSQTIGGAAYVVADLIGQQNYNQSKFLIVA